MKKIIALIFAFWTIPVLAQDVRVPFPPIGTSGGVLCYVNTACTWSALQTYSLGLSISSSQTLDWNSDVILSRDAAATLAIVNSTNSQTVRIYNTFTNASNYSRLALTFSSNTYFLSCEAAGTGTCSGGYMRAVNTNWFGVNVSNAIWNVTASNALVPQNTADNTYDIGTSSVRVRDFYLGRNPFFNGLSTDATKVTNTLCADTTTGQVYKGSGALGICLGTSGRQFKTEFAPMQAGLAEVMKIKLWNYRYKSGYGDGGENLQYGPTAQDVETVLPDLVRHNEKGDAINYDVGAFIPILMRAVQELKVDNDNLRAELRSRK